MRARAHSIGYARRKSPEDTFVVYFSDPDASAGVALGPSGQVTGDSLGETELETVASGTESYVNKQVRSPHRRR